MQQTNGQIESPMPLACGRFLQPAEPPEVAFHSIVGPASGTVIKTFPSVVIPIYLRGEAQLAEIAGAFDSLRQILAPRQGWQKQRRQNPDDGNHDKQLDQSEGTASHDLKQVDGASWDLASP
jgi:hypothetical protein